MQYNMKSNAAGDMCQCVTATSKGSHSRKRTGLLLVAIGTMSTAGMCVTAAAQCDPAQLFLDNHFEAGLGPTSVVGVDLDSDGALDLATANEISDDVSVLLNTGEGLFAPAIQYDLGDRPNSITAGDFDGNGALDLAMTIGADDDISVLLANGDGTFQREQRFDVGNLPQSIVVVDLNDDGGGACPNLS